ncbi:MAG: hypothetical protein U9N10_00740 [Bacillota bacterium]|nr:hypothetical protein [Bacillota bacterium]
MQVKKILMLCFILIILSVPVYATENIELQEKVDVNSTRFSNINLFQNTFEIEKYGKVVLTSAVDARNTDEIKISMYLQKYEDGRWQTVKHWSTIQSGAFAVLGIQRYVASGYQYRMKSYAYVYKSDVLLESAVYTSGTELY